MAASFVSAVSGIGTDGKSGAAGAGAGATSSAASGAFSFSCTGLSAGAASSGCTASATGRAVWAAGVSRRMSSVRGRGSVWAVSAAAAAGAANRSGRSALAAAGAAGAVCCGISSVDRSRSGMPWSAWGAAAGPNRSGRGASACLVSGRGAPRSATSSWLPRISSTVSRRASSETGRVRAWLKPAWASASHWLWSGVRATAPKGPVLSARLW